jgi:CBS-domain-containing membrane protein
MTCRSIMMPNSPVLQTDDKVGTAVDMLLAHKLLALPVIDRAGLYKGMFAKSRLFGLALPAVVAIEQMLPHVAQLPDLDFLPDYLPEMRERLKSVWDHPVGEYADNTVPVVRPDSPIVAAVLIVFRTRNFVPVVDPQTKKLVGLVSTWDTIAKIREGL